MAEFEVDRFPYPIVTVDGAAAERMCQRLVAGQAAVMLGDDDQASRVLEGLEYDARSPEQILAIAATLRFPEDLIALRAKEDADFEAQFGSQPFKVMVFQPDGSLRPETAEESQLRDSGPALGDWPDAPEQMVGFLARNVDGSWKPRIHVAILPTADPNEAPAFLKFGNWNQCPRPEHHVAALRRWRQLYGARVTACGPDVLELRVERRPQERDEALLLARELYLYCDEGFQTFAAMAASLSCSDQWSFWWD